MADNIYFRAYPLHLVFLYSYYVSPEDASSFLIESDLIQTTIKYAIIFQKKRKEKKILKWQWF